jgi:hypothetical protein
VQKEKKKNPANQEYNFQKICSSFTKNDEDFLHTKKAEDVQHKTCSNETQKEFFKLRRC